jgi:hypothetical protein
VARTRVARSGVLAAGERDDGRFDLDVERNPLLQKDQTTRELASGAVDVAALRVSPDYLVEISEAASAREKREAR